MYKNEQQILKIIKYTPPLFIICLGIIITIFLFVKNKQTFEEEKTRLVNEYNSVNKARIEEKINRIHEYIINTQQNSKEDLKKELKDAVFNAYSIAKTVYDENKDKTEEEVIKMIKDALRNIRFNDGRGYFFIYTMDGTNVLHPILTHLEGKDLSNYQDTKGKFISQELKKRLSSLDETFFTWHWTKPNAGKKEYEKIGFFKVFEPFNWYIGTGEYLVDYEQRVQSRVIDFIDNLTYGKNGYVFVIDYAGNFLSHIQLELQGKNAFTINKVKNEVEQIIEVAKKGEGFLSYVHFKKPETGIPTPKISFIKGLQNWNWAIGEGFYKDDTDLAVAIKEEELNRSFTQNVQNILIICLLVTGALIVFSLYVSRRLEQKFQKYQDEIDNRLDENIKQHNMLSQQSKMAAMGEMIGNIAHQWRQPLSTITAASTGLKFEKKYNKLTDENFFKTVDKITDSAQYLSHTIDDFRNFFKSDKNRNKFLVGEVIDKTIGLLETQLKSKEIIVLQDIDDIMLINLENELIQVLLNLVNNARDELIKLQNQSRIILIKAYKEDGFVWITVQDSAGGIPKQNMERIFEPYFTTKHQSRGTGIGLYMSSQIINIHMSGNLTAYNTSFSYEGKEYFGAKFMIKLPLEFNQ